MPQLPTPINPSDYTDMHDFTPVPPGKYIAAITSSSLKDTKAGGQMLVFNFSILAGLYTGKGFITRLNLRNANPDAVRMANEEFSTILRACKLGPQTSSEPLHNIPMVVTLKLIPGDGQYGAKNEASYYATTEGYSRDNIPVNPEPDAITQEIIAGVMTSAAPTASTTSNPTEAVPPPGFGAAPADPARTEEKPKIESPAPPPGFGDIHQGLGPAPTPEQPAPQESTASPPW